MAPPSPGGRRPVAGHPCADLSSEGADVAEPEAEAMTGLGADTAVAAPAPEQAATVQTASSLVPPQGHSQVKRLKVVDLKSLWTRAEKRPKPSIASNSTPILQTVESNIQCDSPSVQLQTHNEIEVQPEPEVASTDAVPAAVVQEDQPEGNDDEFDDYEINEEAFYDVNWLPHDPGERIPISSYNPNDQADVRKRYIALGACQPRGHDFPRKDIGGKRRFVPSWFDTYGWLEYSVKLDAAFCFVCYLFKNKTAKGGNSFVDGGFRLWNHTSKFDKHAACMSHCLAQEKFDKFSVSDTSIVNILVKRTTEEKVMYKARLSYSLRCLRFLLRQGLTCRGHDESEESLNKGNFLKLLNWLAENFEDVNRVVLKNAPKNNKLMSPRTTNLRRLTYQLDNFIVDMRGDERFSKVKTIAELSVLLVQTNKHVLTLVCLQASEISPIATSCNSKC